MAASQPGPRFGGWRKTPAGVLEAYAGTTKVAALTAGALAVTGALTATTTIAATTTITAGTGLTVTTGNSTITAGDLRVTAGNARLGAVSAFATTEPTSAIVFKQGTAFAGAITTSGGLMSNGTVLRKIIADGTVSNVET